MRDLLKSNNTLVLITESPAFKVTDETGYLFSAVQNSSYSFQMDRASVRQIGRKKPQIDDINRHPDVDLNIDYFASPAMYNEVLMGLNFSIGRNFVPVGLLEGLNEKSYNFHFYNHPEQGSDAIEYFKSADLSIPNSGEVISIGNAYLNSYGMSFQNNSIPLARATYKCSNIEASLYEGPIKSPAINLQSGNSLGVGNINLQDSVLSGTVNEIPFDSSNPTIVNSSCGLDLRLENIQVGGQSISEEEHIIESFDFRVNLERVPLYGLGSDYVYGRKIQYPIRGDISISSKVDNYDSGFISGLLASEEDYEFEFTVRDKLFAVKLLFDNVKLNSFTYSMGVNNEMIYDANFQFLSYDKKGLNGWPFSLGPSVVYDSLDLPIRSTAENIPTQWSQNDLTAALLYLGNNVSEVGDFAFDGCQNITGRLFVPDTVLSIGQGSFKDCSSFDGLLFLSDYLKEIKSDAFLNCVGFDSLYLGNSISSVGDGAFYNCNSITGDLSIPESLTSIGSEAFYNCSSFTEKIIIGQNVTIGANGFEGCNFDTLEVSNSVTNVQNGNYDYWSDWDINLSFDLSVKTIGDYSFDNYIFIGDLNIPKFAENIGKGAFLNCLGFDGSLNFLGSKLKLIDNSGFKNCSNFTGNLTLPDSLTDLGDSAFYNCQSLGSDLNLGKNIINIGKSCFEDCFGFVGDLTIFDNVDSVGERAFANCNGLNGKITLNYETIIGVDAFLGCDFDTLGISDSLVSVNDGNYDEFLDFTGSLEIGNEIVTIGDYAFDGYSFEGQLYITDKVKTIGVGAFSGCSSFSGPLNIGLKTISVGTGAFADCFGFDSSLTLSESLINVEDKAFFNCNQLTGALVIPDKVTNIGSSAFENCLSLNGVISIGESLKSVGEKSFADCISLTGSLVFPSSLESIGAKAFSNCILLDGNLDLGENTSSISDGAFSGCIGFDQSLRAGKNITFGNNVFDGCSFNKLIVKGSATVVDEGNFSFYLPFVTNSSLSFETGVEIINTGAFSGYAFTGDLDLSNSILEVRTSAFENCGFDRYLYFSDSIKKIDDKAFKNTEFIGDLDFPELLIDLGNEAFYNCSGFTGDLVMGSNFNSVGDASFYNCYGFDGVLNLGDTLEEIGKSGFKNCYNLNGDLNIPSSVLFINDEAFKSCTGFDGGIILGSVLRIENQSFSGCSNLTGVLDVPSFLEYMGDYSFANCSSLEVLCISNKIQSGVQPFLGCDFKELCVSQPVSGIVSDGDYDWYKNPIYSFDTQSSLTFNGFLRYIGDNAFDNFGFTGDLILPDFLTGIGSGAFYNCQNFIGDLDIGASIKYIGEDAFKNCFGFDGSLVVGQSLEVSDSAFENTNFSNLKIKESITEISDGEFDFFSQISGSLTLPSTLMKINKKTFDNYSFTGSLLLPDYLELIDKSGFYGCDGFEGDLIISGSGGDYPVGDYAFYNCTGFDGQLRISENVSIGKFAFENTNFSNVEISGSGLKIDDRVEIIEFGSFEKLSGSFSSIEFPDIVIGLAGSVITSGITSIESNVFSNYTVLDGHLKLPCSLTGIGDNAFSGCSGYDSLEIPNDVQLNSTNTFADCNFQGLVVPGCNDQISSSNYVFYKDLGYDVQSYLEISEGVAVINASAFNSYGFTGYLELPASLTYVGSESFRNCSGLSSLQINTGLQFIDVDAFNGCTSLTGLTFYGADPSLDEFFPLKNGYSLTTLRDRAFKDCNNIIDMDFLPEGLGNIGVYAFENCTGLSLNTFDDYPGFKGIINIPESVTSVGAGAFKNTLIAPSGGGLYAGTGAVLTQQTFENCTFGLLHIPASVDLVGSTYDFIEPLIAPQGLTLRIDAIAIAQDQFKDWDLVGDLVMPNFRGSYPGAFHNAYNSPLAEDRGQLVLGNGLKELILTGNCFENCSSFTGELDLSSPTRGIGKKTFKGCSNLEGLILPTNTLRGIDDYAFSGCSSINTPLVFGEPLLGLGIGAFENCSSIGGNVIFKDAISLISQDCFKGCNSINNIYINRDASIVGAGAFSGPGGSLFVTTAHIASYGGVGASFQGMTVALWSNYPNV